ncbi:uncharacterized protein LOC110037725 [Phalaenopsis equestris]|uniref:uncharacterized protein LOC110037725 n=1 Tax=Phalaenopsis equestris TaxID=78828 RepID=UPI0009E2EE61|nr:uncharacterized protein LOC110037725 [Phalaenopsis equestris]XP_020598094.1 uncharacterized protein LOC110037725 [Phalaenopsis equestris]
MYRTTSTTRVSDEYYMSAGQVACLRSAAGLDHLPMYGPQMEIAKKEAAHLRFAENMVHLIPVVIIICATVLWMFSNPNIEMMSRDDSILARIKNLTIDGYNNWNNTAVTVGIEDLDPIDGIATEDSGRNIDNKNQYK